MNEEPTQALSSTKFNLFDLSTNHLKINSDLTLNKNNISFLKNESQKTDELIQVQSDVVDHDIVTTSWPANNDEENDFFSLNESINDEIFNSSSEQTHQISSSNINSDTIKIIDFNSNVTTNTNKLNSYCNAFQLNNETNVTCTQLQINSKEITNLNEDEYFTLTVIQNGLSSISEQTSHEIEYNLTIESVSDNIFSFLKLKKDNLIGSHVSSIIQNDLSKFQDLFHSLSQQTIDLTDNAFKLKPFVCQIYVNSSNIEKDTLLKTSNNLKTFEPMILFPISINGKNGQSSSQYYTSSIKFAVKTLKKSDSPIKNSIEEQPVSSISLSNSPKQPAISVLSHGFFGNTNNDFNMDQFKTKMTEKGFITSAETENLKNCFSGDSNSSATTSGFIHDIRMGKAVNIFEYVHTNDQNHILQHIQNVMSKNENTSAIYRLKINEKYAFLQTQSCLISKKDSTNDESPLICSIHSIIKEIDTDVEMKGNASTSLMKTLISKKPSLALNKTEQKSKNSSLNNILDSLVIEEPSNSLSQSSLRKTPVSPIGTKFAMTMLGISSSLAQQRNNDRTTMKPKYSTKEALKVQSSNESGSCILTDGLNEANPTDENLLLEKKRKILSDTTTIRTNNDEIYSSRKNNFLLKKLLSDGECIEYVVKDVSEKNGFEDFISDNKNQDSVDQPITSSPILSPMMMKEESRRKTNKHEPAKEDIILRTLLNTSDSDPQLLKLDSVFELNSSNKKNDTKKTTRKICVESTRKRKKVSKSDTLGLDSDESAAFELKKLAANKKQPKKSTDSSNRRNSNNTIGRGLYTNIMNDMSKTTIDGRQKSIEFLDGNNQIQPQDPMNSQLNNTPSIKLEKMSYPNYLNKENDSISSQKHLDYNDNNQQNYSNINNSSIISKKLKVDTSQQNNVYQLQMKNQPAYNISLHQSIKQEANCSFPSSLASSNISVSSTSSLSSPISNNLAAPNNNSSTLSGITTLSNTDHLNHNPDNSPFLNFTDDLLDGFNLSQTPSNINNSHKTANNRVNNNEYDQSIFNQLGQVSIDSKTLLLIGDHQASNSIEDSRVVKEHETNAHNQYNPSIMDMSPNKDDDLTKKKRIDAISKHLKFDLIESFKSAQFSSSLNYYESSSSSNQGLLQPASVSSYQKYQNDSLDQSLNESYMSVQSNISNPSSNKGLNVIALTKLDDTYVPNISIEPMMILPNDSKNKQIASKSISNNKNPELGITSHHFNQMPSESPNYISMNTQAPNNYKNDPRNDLRKKLQEHIQQRNPHPYPQPPITNIISPNPYFQQHQQNQPFYNQDVPMNSNPVHTAAQQYNLAITTAPNNPPFSQPTQIQPPPYNQQVENFPVGSINKSEQTQIHPPIQITTQSSPLNTNLKSQYLSQENLEIDTGMDSVTHNFRTIDDNQPVDFNNKQFISPVNKRIYQANDLKQQNPYNNQNNFNNDAYMTRTTSIDMHQQMTPLPHQYPNNQYGSQPYQHQKTPHQQPTPYYNNSPGLVSKKLNFDQPQSHVNHAYPSNQYHSHQQFNYQNSDQTRQNIIPTDDLQMNNYPAVSLNQPIPQQVYSSNYNTYNSMNTNQTNNMYQNHPNPQPKYQGKSSDYEASNNFNYPQTYPQYETNNVSSNTNNTYYEEDQKSLLQQLLLD